MALERLAPDAVLSQVNLSGSVTAIQDDPDSPDTVWLTCPDNTSNCAVHVSFPTPSGSLTGSQNARVRVRPTSAGSNAGTASVDVLVNGSVIASSSTVTVSATQVIAVSFDASLVSDRTALEVRVNGTSAAGKASNRKSVEVGAIEVNASVAESVPAVTGSGGVVFPFALSGQAAQAFSGAGGVTFGWSVAGDGTYTPVAVSGSGGVTFSATFDGAGMVQSAAITGSGGVMFGFTADGAGEVITEALTGTGGVTFGFSLAGEGTYTPRAIVGDGGVAFIFSVGGEATYTPLVIAGSGGVTFGFSLDGAGAALEAGAIVGSGSVIFGWSIYGEGSVVVIVGDVDPAQVVAALERLAEQGQVAAMTMLNRGGDPQGVLAACLERVERGSVVAHRVLGPAIGRV